MSKDTFKDNPELQEYFETSDGTAFYKEDLAKNHARNLEDKSVKPVFRKEGKTAKGNDEGQKETFADIIAKAPEMDLETLVQYIDAENLLPKPRKSVVDALAARLDELENPKD